MPDDGTRLEDVVAQIERRLLPLSFTVETRRNIFNDDGVQIAEFDIDIRGHIGSSDVHWLIECRDRPSSGPAPGSWIEQLYGRRERFGIDRVFAVSTTGFSVGAVEFASQRHIVLRAVEDITAIPDSLIVREIFWTDDDVGVGDATFIAVDSNTRMSTPLGDLMIVVNGDTIDAGDFIIFQLEESDLYEERIHAIATVEALRYRCDSTLEAIFHGRPMTIRELQAPLHVTKQACEGRLLLAQQYSEDDRVIGQMGEFEFTTRGGPQMASVQVTWDALGEQQIHAVLRNGSPVQGEIRIL